MERWATAPATPRDWLAERASWSAFNGTILSGVSVMTLREYRYGRDRRRRGQFVTGLC
jgi:hypothetical protein